MQSGTLLMMVLILGLVWGGFAWLLWRSIRIDSRRRS